MSIPVEPVAEQDDVALMAAIAAGDQQAFLRFYRRYSTVAYSLALRITGREHDAEDVISDVFWEIWNKSDRYSASKASPYTYLVMLTRCRALDVKRRLARHAAHPILDWARDELRPLAPHDDAPDLPCSIIEQRRLVRQALEQLQPNQRQAVESAFFDGLSHQATAEKLGLPVGTVKGRIRAALATLRKTLNSLRNE